MKPDGSPVRPDIYRATELPGGGWTVECSTDGVVPTGRLGRYDSRTAAAGAASVLNRIRRAEVEPRLGDNAPGSPSSE
jgi:hypothetical protein